jgi:2-oxoglutarate dehydrogenase E1 component
MAALVDPLFLRDKEPVESLDLAFHGLTSADLEASFNADFPGCPPTMPLREIIDFLQQTYCDNIGWEYAYINDREQVTWLREQAEQNRGRPSFSADVKREILAAVVGAEGLERYLHRRYVGQKRFSLEGGDSLIPLMDQLVQHAGSMAAKEIVIGMAHRGRLNVLVNILGKKPGELFAEFEGSADLRVDGSGDVKYHQGFSSDLITSGGGVHITLAFNPSHLEIINPVVEGSVRSRQERRDDLDRNQVLPILVHGDAAFAGQGVVMETLNLCNVRGYTTGGTVHLVINNQIGFTTSNPVDARSTHYCTDIAKLIQAPIIHVNGNDPEAVVHAANIAMEYRAKFHNDVVIDMVCFRRHGHNEADEPALTQPIMYAKVDKQKTVREIYAAQLEQEGVIEPGEGAQQLADYQQMLTGDDPVALRKLSPQKPVLLINWEPYFNIPWTAPCDTAVQVQQLATLGDKLTTLPSEVTPHARVAKILADRRAMTHGDKPMDWGCAETLAYATLLSDGYRIRLSGQDSGRGTFSHRHSVIHHQTSERAQAHRYVPLQHLAPNQPRFLVIDSLLSEEAVLGFEFGYATADPETLVIWEAQFGDFANGAQVVIDQFISSSWAKWERLCGMVMLLPHGYEGQGPEHSSARLERYLQLCAENNMQVCVPTTPAQMFHLLRRQMLRPFRRPLIIMTPKSLLRHKQAVSTLDDLTQQQFHLVIDDQDVDAEQVERVVVCSGRVYYDLLAARAEAELTDQVALLRIEQLYPFPLDQARAALGRYHNANQVVWAQEEPQNQGAWYSSQHHMRNSLAQHQQITFAGRPHSASPAAGYMARHQAQLHELLDQALRSTN